MSTIYLMCPHKGSYGPGVTHLAMTGAPGHRLCFKDNSFGCLTHNFNMLLALGWNLRKEHSIDYIAMCHDDISAEEGALSKLVLELDRTGADIISVVIPFKDTSGLTSTGLRDQSLDDRGEMSWSVRRLSLTEIHKLPETFSIEDTDEPGKILAFNTGLCLARMGDWVGDFCRAGGFHVENRMAHDAEADTFAPDFFPEDWQFATWAQQHGLRALVTRKVRATHWGTAGFCNDRPGGDQPYDLQFCTLDQRQHFGGATVPTTITPNGDAASWCPPVWDRLLDEGIHSVLDVGCGAGFAARYFERQGCQVLGIDGDKRLAACYVGDALMQHDFYRGPAPIERDYDLAWCCELLEHIDSQYERFALDTLAHARTIALTHAFPGDAGVHHVNCQPSEYWIDRITQLGYRYDGETTEALRATVNHDSDIGHHFARSGLVFRRVEAS